MKNNLQTYQPLFLWGIFGILVSMIGYFAVINQIKHERYTDVFSTIDKLQEIEISINEHVLQNMNHLNLSDSLLKNDFSSFVEHWTLLKNEKLLEKDNLLRCNKILDSLNFLLHKKKEVIDVFNDRNILLQKALMGMSLESILLYEQIPQKYLQEDVNLLVNQVFINFFRKEEISRERVIFYQDQLKKYKHLIQDEDSKNQVEFLLRDTEIVLKQKPIVDELIKEVLEISLVPKIQELYLLYNDDYQKQLKAKQQIKIVLYLLSVILSILVVFFVYKVSESTKKLKELNNNLENQIEERTHLIEEREKLLNEFLSFLPVGIYIVDKHKQPLYVNEQCKKLFPNVSEYHHAEYFLSFLEIYNIDTDEKYSLTTHPIYLVLESNQKMKQFFYLLNNETNEKTYISMSSTPVFEDEIHYVLRHVIIVFENITEQVKREKEIIESKKRVEEAVKVKEQFLAIMSHELRTPLNAVVGISHLLLEQEYLKKQYDNLSTLKFSAENLMLIINDILDYSKIQAGKIIFEEGIIYLGELLEKIQAIFLPQAKKNETEFLVSKKEDVPDFLIGDSLRLVQIINNLVSNAIKFTHNGKVELVVLKKRETLKKITLCFEIKDTGIGISKDKIESIFDSFSQESSTTTRKYGGTGLGLTITKQLVELQGGKIEVQSQLNKGSIFSFELTFFKTNKTLEGTQKETYQALNLKILVVEDSEVNQMVVVQFLKQWRNEVFCVNDGKKAVEILQKEQYDVVLMDIHMPIMDGIEATQEIRKAKNLVPIIALTATVSEMKDKIMSVGMNGIVHKPFNPQELYHVLREITELKQK